MKIKGIISALGIVCTFILLNVIPSFASNEEPLSKIQGIVYIDENLNCQFDQDETVLEDVIISLTNGELIHETVTDEGGFFEFNVGIGVWIAEIHPPEGYAILNDATREVEIEAQSPSESLLELEFALILEGVAEQCVEVPDGNPSENVSEEVTEPGVEIQTDTQTEFYDGEVPTPVVTPDTTLSETDQSAGLLDTVLPESGFPFPPKWVLVVFVFMILWVGAFLIFLGRRLSR